MGIWGIYENVMVNKYWGGMFFDSNVSVTLYSLITVILILLGSKLQHKLYFKFKGILLFCNSIIHIVFVVLVIPEFKKNPKLAVYMNHPAIHLAHYVVPWLFILDYLLFDEKGHFKWYDAFIWNFVVLLYNPYPSAFFILAFLILAWIFILIDYSIAKLTNKLSKKFHKD